jgi:DNA-binding response OmpR family regulator
MPVILAVDDVAEVTRLIADALEPAGYKAETAATAADGLARIADGGIDLVVLDRILPDVDGLEVCRRLRAGQRPDYLPVIMLTGLGDETTRHEGFPAGADDYLTKPLSPRELRDRVEVWLRIRQTVERNASQTDVPSTATRFRAVSVLPRDWCRRVLTGLRHSGLTERAAAEAESLLTYFVELDPRADTFTDLLAQYARDRRESLAEIATLLQVAWERMLASERVDSNPGNG